MRRDATCQGQFSRPVPLLQLQLQLQLFHAPQMALPTTDKCCCCFTLRLGCIILSSLGVLGSLIGVIKEPQEPTDESSKAFNDYLEDHTVVLYLFKFLFVVDVVCYVSLLIGAILMNRTLVWIFVVGSLGALIIQVPLTAFICIAIGIYVGLLSLLFFILPLYFIWVGYSFHKEMEARLP